MKLVLASDNKGKLREFGSLFADHGIEVVSQGALGVTPCEEPFCTFLENALAKARNAAKTTGLPAMADDSGITAHALVTEPGAFGPLQREKERRRGQQRQAGRAPIQV